MNGDTLCGLDVSAMARAHRATGADVTLAVVPNPAPDRYNGIQAQEGGEVLRFVPKGQARIRVQVSAVHERADLDHAVAAFTQAGRELGMVRPGAAA